MILAWVTIIAQCFGILPSDHQPCKISFPFSCAIWRKFAFVSSVAVFFIPEDVSLLSGASEIICAE